MFGFGSKDTSSANTTTTTPVSPSSITTPLSELGGSNKLQQLKAQVRQEMSVAHAQELVQAMTRHCFEACVPVPGSSFTAQQQKCTSQCAGLYTQAWSVIQRSYIERVQQEQSKGSL